MSRESLPLLNGTGILCSPESKNPKTGNIPQVYIGRTKEETEASCRGCPMFKEDPETGEAQKSECYYHSGSAQMGHGALRNSYNKGRKNDDLALVIQSSSRSAQYVRLAVGGDPQALTLEQVQSVWKTAKDNGFKGVLGYTHFSEPRSFVHKGKKGTNDGSHLKGLVMASCDDMEQADRMVDKGWRAAVVVPAIIPGAKPSKAKRWEAKGMKPWNGETFTTPKGRKVTLCPAQTGGQVKNALSGRMEDITCNTCGMCDPSRRKGGDVIGFLMH